MSFNDHFGGPAKKLFARSTEFLMGNIQLAERCEVCGGSGCEICGGHGGKITDEGKTILSLLRFAEEIEREAK